MKTLSIKGDIRETPGKKSSKLLRRNNQVPCILYGGKEETYFSSDERNFKKLIYSPDAYNVKLSIGDKNLNAVMQDVQFHPVTDKIIHIDFVELFEDNNFRFLLNFDFDFCKRNHDPLSLYKDYAT